MNDITYKLTLELDHLTQIIDLQKANHKSAVPDHQKASEGFVTVQHDISLLERIGGDLGHTVALCQDKVVGYALTMLKEYNAEIEILEPMFDVINSSSYKGIDLSTTDYVSMGQICVDQSYRGRGIFRGLYDHMSKALKGKYTHIITEVDPANIRSCNAHQKVGFDVLHATDEWEIIILEIE